MSSSGTPAGGAAPSPVLRLVVREIVPGDRRKFTATSNDVDSGGGARDLRFRPEDKFAPVLARMFPMAKIVNARRSGATVQLKVYTGQIQWRDTFTPGQVVVRTGQAEIWPATDARPGEIRLIKVHQYGFSPLLPPAQVNGKTVMMLIQDAQGAVWVWFYTEAAIRAGNWHPSIKPFLLRWLDSNLRSGFIDFQTREELPT